MTYISREILKSRLDVDVPVTCSTHQCVKGNAESMNGDGRKCVFCSMYKKNINCDTCTECLGTPNLDHFKTDYFWWLSIRTNYPQLADVYRKWIPDNLRDKYDAQYASDAEKRRFELVLNKKSGGEINSNSD